MTFPGWVSYRIRRRLGGGGLPTHWKMAEMQPPASLRSAGGLIHSSGAWPQADFSTHLDISRHSPTCFVKCGKLLKKKFQGAWPNLEGRGRPSTWPGPLFWLFRQPRFARQAAVFTVQGRGPLLTFLRALNVARINRYSHHLLTYSLTQLLGLNIRFEYPNQDIPIPHHYHSL
jgi:hypothetical protein